MDKNSLLGKEPVYILIPVHNRRETTLECLKHLRQTGVSKKYHVVVIDDASTDGTAEIIAELYPDTLIVPGDGNLWWTGAIALGMQYAAERKATHFIWLNDDCVPVGDTLFRIVDYMYCHPNTIVAPTCYVETPEGRLVKQDNAFIGRRGFAASPGEILAAEGLSGWCVGIPAAVYQKIGVPDAKKFPHYSGDDTYIYRATRAGFHACVVGDIEVRLLGIVHPKLAFQNHFDADFKPLSTFNSLFLSKRSPYLLTTKFHYFVERYGIPAGVFLFAIKFFSWLFKWLYLEVSINFNKHFISRFQS
ncbi:glycosyltransferase family 2 protein [Acaryochloris sp. IP29b_bin.148]|uniref:glycosyltransferase family 2 protein n=1 Tax=Acaryochloris sp. IP29b_bin.148 TaxID=2969218 RepID=UPI002615C307|nr:glycosyltransferase family 2 protein [Acaryochloris sp. IP29b_bin.148]